MSDFKLPEELRALIAKARHCALRAGSCGAFRVRAWRQERGTP